jgi:hypothetical protein
MNLRCVVLRKSVATDGVGSTAIGHLDDRPWGTCWWWGYRSPPSALVCADCAGLRRGNTGGSKVVVNEFDVVAMVVGLR